MSKTALLSVKILADAKGASREFDAVGKKIERLESHAKTAAAGMTVATAGVVALGKQAFDAASDLQQSTGAIESIFKQQSANITQLAEAANQAVGLSKNQYQELAAVMGAQLKNMGVSTDNLVSQTDDLIKKGADLAATFGGTTADAVSALSSLMKGETDPIERYGISIKEANIKAELAAQGLDKLEGEAAKTARTQAILKLLNEQSADATGAFAREADTAAGQMQRANAAWADAKAKLGEALLPVVASAAEHFSELAKWVGDHPTLVQVLGGAIIAGTGALYTMIAALKVYTAVSAIAGTTSKALALTGIGAVVTIIAALAAGLYVAYQKSETFRAIIGTIGEIATAVFGNIRQLVADVAQWFSTKFNEIKAIANVLWEYIKGAFNDGISTVVNIVQKLVDKFQSIWEWIKGTTKTIIDIFIGAWNGGVDTVSKIISKVGEYVRALLSPVESFKQTAANAFEWISSKVQYLKDLLYTVYDYIRSLGSYLPSISGITSTLFGASYAPTLRAVNTDHSRVFRAVPPTPTLFAARPTPPRLRVHAPLGVNAPQKTINITINGALDPYQTGQQIKRLLDDYQVRESW